MGPGGSPRERPSSSLPAEAPPHRPPHSREGGGSAQRRSTQLQEPPIFPLLGRATAGGSLGWDWGPDLSYSLEVELEPFIQNASLEPNPSPPPGAFQKESRVR